MPVGNEPKKYKHAMLASLANSFVGAKTIAEEELENLLETSPLRPFNIKFGGTDPVAFDMVIFVVPRGLPNKNVYDIAHKLSERLQKRISELMPERAQKQAGLLLRA